MIRQIVALALAICVLTGNIQAAGPDRPVAIRGTYGGVKAFWRTGARLDDYGINAVFVGSYGIDSVLVRRAKAEGAKVFAELLKLLVAFSFRSGKLGALYNKTARQRKFRTAKPGGQVEISRNLGRQLTLYGTRCGNDDFGTSVETVTRIVQRVDRRPRLKMQVAGPINSLQKMAKEAGRVVHVKLGSVSPIDDHQILDIVAGY